MNAMKQCLRCGNVCTGASIFCENCQLSLLDRSEQKSFQTVPMPRAEIKFLPTTKMMQDDDIDSRPLAIRPLPWVRRRAELRRRRTIFIALALFVIMALIIDGILVTLVFTHSSDNVLHGDAFPLLTLTPDVAYLGQVVQGAPQKGSPAPPLLSLSPSQLTFTVSQGQASRGAQYLTLANAGGRTLTWYATINASATPWLTLAATQGTVSAERTVVLSIDTTARNLVSGTYKAQIVVNALDGSGRAIVGSPQVVSVTLNMQG